MKINKYKIAMVMILALAYKPIQAIEEEKYNFNRISISKNSKIYSNNEGLVIQEITEKTTNDNYNYFIMVLHNYAKKGYEIERAVKSGNIDTVILYDKSIKKYVYISNFDYPEYNKVFTIIGDKKLLNHKDFYKNIEYLEINKADDTIIGALKSLKYYSENKRVFW